MGTRVKGSKEFGLGVEVLLLGLREELHSKGLEFSQG